LFSVLKLTVVCLCLIRVIKPSDSNSANCNTCTVMTQEPSTDEEDVDTSLGEIVMFKGCRNLSLGVIDSYQTPIREPPSEVPIDDCDDDVVESSFDERIILLDFEGLLPNDVCTPQLDNIEQEEETQLDEVDDWLSEQKQKRARIL